MYKRGVGEGVVSPSGEGKLKGREGHLLFSLGGGEIREGKVVYP